MLLSVRCLQKLCSSDKVTFIMGECNLPHIDWSYYHGTDNIIYNSFLKFVNSYNLIQLVDQPTREDNILDLVLLTSDMSISDVDVFPPTGSSDHNVVMFNTNSVNSLNNHCISTPTFLTGQELIRLCYDLCSVNWNHIFQHCFHIEDCWSMFTETLTRSVNEHVPVVHTSTKRDKYPTCHYPRYIIKFINDKGIAWKRWKFSKLECDKLAYKAAAAQCSAAIKGIMLLKSLNLIFVKTI